MATIEINLDAYNALLNEKKELEENAIELRREVIRCEALIDNLESKLDVFESASWYDRIFGWKQILRLTAHDD